MLALKWVYELKEICMMFDDFSEVVSKFGKVVPMEHTEFYKYKH